MKQIIPKYWFSLPNTQDHMAEDPDISAMITLNLRK
jgi:hypothetical protein